MNYNCHKVNFRRGGSYIDSQTVYIKKTVYPNNENDKYFQYAVIVALN